MNDYKDIIDIEYPVKTKRARMSLHDRAAQFAPFAALVGFDSVIAETARYVDSRLELDESMRAELDQALSNLNNDPTKEVSITYFVPDSLKDGGVYLTRKSRIKKIDNINRCLILEDKTKIPTVDIICITE